MGTDQREIWLLIHLKVKLFFLFYGELGYGMSKTSRNSDNIASLRYLTFSSKNRGTLIVFISEKQFFSSP